MLTFDMIRRIYDERAPVKTPPLKVEGDRFAAPKTITEPALDMPRSSEDYFDHHEMPIFFDDYEFTTDGTENDYEYETETEMAETTTEYFPMVIHKGELGGWPQQDNLHELSLHKDRVEPIAQEIEENVGVRTIQCIAAVVSLIALVYGIITWTILPKSRTFNNYVYINSIFTLTLVLWLPYLAAEESLGEAVMYCVLFFEFGFLCWLGIASVLMYRDIVLVFATEIKRKTLKCNIFAWGVPLLGLAVLLSTGNLYFYLCYSIILWAVLVVQVFFYLRVLYCLFSVSQANKPPVTPCRNIQIATFTFFMGGIPVVLEIAISQRPIAMALDIMDPMNLVIQIFLLSPLIVYNVFFIIRKSNRCLWREWHEKRKAVNLFNV